MTQELQLSLPVREFAFRPLPLLGNPHVQTVMAFCLTGPSFAHPSRERHVLLADGDRLVLHDSVPDGWRPGRPVVVVVHGLGGSHASAHVVRQAGALLREGVRVARLDLRGCGSGISLARGTYHAGCSDDLRAAVEEVYRWSPESPIVLLGQSLGGNVVLKLAGEAADEPVPGLARVVAVGPPIDLAACADKMGAAGNALYERFFVRGLVAHLRRRQQHFPDLPAPSFPRRLTVRQFDELYTAPTFGYPGADAYYRGASSFPLIARVEVPTLILTARDDPFIAVEPFERLEAPSHVEVRIAERGGHLGFLGRDGAGGIRWAERYAAAWAAQGA